MKLHTRGSNAETPASLRRNHRPGDRASIEKVRSLFAVRCAVFKIDPDSKDFWRLMSCAFALEHLLARCRPPAKSQTNETGTLDT